MATLKKFKYTTLLILNIFLFNINGTAFALSVIPGATGFGMDTPAGRGGGIIRVTNLNSSGEGSLRAAIEASGPRIVIFEVSGTIVYDGRYKIKNPFITIAGQTAPSPGITLKGSILTVATHDVLIQHLRVRQTDEIGGSITPDNRDCMSIGLAIEPEEYNIVIDHCSASWSIDEIIDIGESTDVTISNCIFSEALNDSLHPKGPHSKGMIMMGDVNNISIIGNLFAHNKDRNPYINDGRNSVFIANNFIYNPASYNLIFQIWRDPGFFTIVGNVVQPGPNSNSSAGGNMPLFWAQLIRESKFYIEDNSTNNGTQKNKDDWSLVKVLVDDLTVEDVEAAVKSDTPPLWPNGFSPILSANVEGYIVKNVGARPADRDAVDSRIISEVIHRSGRMIDSPDDVGGHPVLQVNKVTHNLPSNPNGDDDNDGYTNIEEWLHKMARVVESSISTPEELRIK